MARTTYELTESVAGFDEGAILDVTARFGDWHLHDLKLEPTTPRRTDPSAVYVSEADAGFSETEILDATARFGDWHEYDLAFDPGADETDDPTVLTADEFAAVAEPVDARA
jgi:hypothetical protein